MKIILDRLGDGQLPIMAYQGEWRYIQEHLVPTDPLGLPTLDREPYNYEWGLARTTSRQHARAAVPLVEIRVERFIEMLRGLPENNLETDGCLYIPIRASYELHGLAGRWLVIGAALFPTGPFPAAIDGDLRVIEEFCTLRWMERPPEHESLIMLWDEIQTQRDTLDGVFKKREESFARSQRLLLGQLNEAQRQEFEAKQRFTVTGRDRRQYLITYKSHGNVWLLNSEGKPVMNYCIVTEDSEIPIYDQMLSQKLMLEYDPESFFTVANPMVVGPNLDNPVALTLYHPD